MFVLVECFVFVEVVDGEFGGDFFGVYGEIEYGGDVVGCGFVFGIDREEFGEMFCGGGVVEDVEIFVDVGCE